MAFLASSTTENVFIFLSGTFIIIQGSLGAYMYNETPSTVKIDTYTIYLRDAEIFFIGYGVGFLFMHIINSVFGRGKSNRNFFAKIVIVMLCLVFASVCSYDSYVFNSIQGTTVDKVQAAKAEGVSLAFVGIGVGVIIAIILESIFSVLFGSTGRGKGRGFRPLLSSKQFASLAKLGKKRSSRGKRSSVFDDDYTAAAVTSADTQGHGTGLLTELQGGASEVGGLFAKEERLAIEEETGPAYFAGVLIWTSIILIVSSSINFAIYDRTGKTAKGALTFAILGLLLGVILLVLGIILIVSLVK